MRSSLPAGADVVAFQCRNPIHRAHYELFTRAAHAPNVRGGAVVLVHPTVGPTQVGASARVWRACRVHVWCAAIGLAWGQCLFSMWTAAGHPHAKIVSPAPLIKRTCRNIKRIPKPNLHRQQDDDIPGLVRYHTYEVLKEEIRDPSIRWAYLPYSMHMAGPREAIQHMIIRKNYGERELHSHCVYKLLRTSQSPQP